MKLVDQSGKVSLKKIKRYNRKELERSGIHLILLPLFLVVVDIDDDYLYDAVFLCSIIT